MKKTKLVLSPDELVQLQRRLLNRFSILGFVGKYGIEYTAETMAASMASGSSERYLASYDYPKA